MAWASERIELNKSKCTKCGEVLTLDNCVIEKKRVRVKSWCKSCTAQYMKEYKANNVDKHKEYDLKQYGISLGEYKRKIELQFNGCAICKQPCASGQDLSVDHNHKTNQVRDLLCKRCNVIIGMCGEDESLLFAIIEYLKRHDLRKVG